jgi:uncharacterized protein (DUF2267 family)
MTTNRVDIIDRSVEKTHIWLNELAAELGTEDRKYAYRVLRAVLHAVRDRLAIIRPRCTWRSCGSAT